MHEGLEQEQKKKALKTHLHRMHRCKQHRDTKDKYVNKNCVHCNLQNKIYRSIWNQRFRLALWLRSGGSDNRRDLFTVSKDLHPAVNLHIRIHDGDLSGPERYALEVELNKMLCSDGSTYKGGWFVCA